MTVMDMHYPPAFLHDRFRAKVAQSFPRLSV